MRIRSVVDHTEPVEMGEAGVGMIVALTQSGGRSSSSSHTVVGESKLAHSPTTGRLGHCVEGSRPAGSLVASCASFTRE